VIAYSFQGLQIIDGGFRWLEIGFSDVRASFLLVGSTIIWMAIQAKITTFREAFSRGGIQAATPTDHIKKGK